MNNTSNRTIRVGFIGAGFIGQLAHIDNYSQVTGCEIVSIAEMRDDLRESVANKYQIPNTFTNHTDLLAHGNIDAVVVVTARQHTANVVEDCLRAGLHVLSEKPMALSSDRARQLIAIAESYKVKYCVGYMKRYDQGVQKAKAILSDYIAKASLGQLLHVKACCYMGDSYCNASGNIHSIYQRPEMCNESELAPSWLRDSDKPLFARYTNVYSHLTNLVSYLLENKSSPDVDYFNFISPLAHTCVLNHGEYLFTLETGEVTLRDWNESCEFIFEQGILKLILPPALLRNTPAKIIIEKGGQDAEKVEHSVDWSWAFKVQAEHFIHDIVNNSESIIDAQYALNDLELIENIWRKR